MDVGTVEPKNRGSCTIEPAHKTQTFQLNFEFSTRSFNEMDYVATLYQLEYNGPATVQRENSVFR